ncbi:MAG: hypothetical protein ABR514_04820 [Chthoniobacterales bacterium]
MKHTKKAAPENDPPRRAKARRPVAGIREAEQARTLLQDQLHGLYWWVFNACRIKGFLRAKQLDKIEAESEGLSEKQNTEPAASAKYPATELK